jgi:cytochrome b561
MSDHPSLTPFYTLLQRRLHWAVIALISVQYLLHDAMHDALRAIEQQEPLGFSLFLIVTIHTWGGATIAALMLWRWQLRKRSVPLNAGQITQQRAFWVTAHHVCLYVAVLLMALTGAMHYYLAWPLAGRWHELGKWLLLALIAVHVAGAVSHLGRGNRVLQRMMGRGSLR